MQTPPYGHPPEDTTLHLYGSTSDPRDAEITYRDQKGSLTSIQDPLFFLIAMADQDDSEKHGLFFLNEAQFTQLDETEILYPVDIVAIHGINGGAYETWRHMNGTLWLQDLLPADLPGCRVFTSGYSSATAFGSSAEELDDVAFAILLDLNFQRPSIKVLN
ncbi:hypothetical protein TWF225_011838 [Orbilia oligospora]|nr:hypothetical protein TWF225_011838 [Orbilia oligospora]